MDLDGQITTSLHWIYRKLTKEDILKQYPENFEGLGCLGPPVHFEVKADVSPVQMPIHRIAVAKRIKEKEALDRYAAAVSNANTV